MECANSVYDKLFRCVLICREIICDTKSAPVKAGA